MFGKRQSVGASEFPREAIFEQRFELRAGPGVLCEIIFRHHQTLFLSAEFG